MPDAYSISLLPPTGEIQRCEADRDDTQPCSSDWASYLVQRPDGRTRPMCGNHAARFAYTHRLPFPVASRSNT